MEERKINSIRIGVSQQGRRRGIGGRTKGSRLFPKASGRSHQGFLEYIDGDKEAASGEFQAAQKLDPDLKKQFDATISWEKQFKVVGNGKEVLNKLPASR